MPFEEYRFKRKSSCKDCPLDGLNKVYGIGNEPNPTVVMIGEAPGENEAKEGVPFVGPAGTKLKNAVGRTRMMYSLIYKTNRILCRPPKNKIDSPEGKLALECCKEGFLEELKELVRRGTKVLVPLGNTAMAELIPGVKISKARGSVYSIEIEDKVIPVIPTYHPSFILRGQFKEEATWIADLNKVHELSKKTYKKIKEDFILEPTLKEVMTTLKEVRDKGTLISVDLETTGLDPFYANIVMVGIGLSKTKGICIPFLKQGGSEYWSWEDERKVLKEIQMTLKKVPAMYQNSLFDRFFLKIKGIETKPVEHDTLICHHALMPELKHNLGYISSVYGETPYWKDLDLKGNERAIFSIDDTTFRTYNLRDCVVLHQIIGPLLKDVKEDKLEETYKLGLELTEPILEMEVNGIPLNRNKLKTYKAKVKRNATIAYKKMLEVGELPKNFNIDSPDDLRLLFFSIEPAKYTRAKQELKEKYGKDSKLRKDTKKYKNLLEIVETTEAVVPLYRTTATMRKTAGGQAQLDEQAVFAIKNAALRRLDEIKMLRRRRKTHDTEEKELNRLISFTNAFMKYQEYNKQVTTYTKFPVREDGAVHGKYLVHGTATGRLSSRQPNLQNIAKEAKIVFETEKGTIFLQADFSNLEMRVLSFISDDDVLQDMFDKGLNVHSENCKLMFALKEDNPLWKQARHACKTYIFGRMYGGTVGGIFERVAKQVPELNLTKRKFEEIDSAYMKAHPKYREWRKNVVKDALANRAVFNAFGRKRTLFGTYQEIERIALNTPIQSTAADIMNKGMISLFKDKKRKELKMDLRGTVHDSILVTVPDKKESINKSVRLLKKHLEQKYVINGYEVQFPVDFETGTCWGNLKELQ